MSDPSGVLRNVGGVGWEPGRVRSRTTCPGCGVILPVVPDPTLVASLNSSHECAAVHAEVLGFEFQHPVMLRYHQLSVDAYGAQHAGGQAPVIRVGYSLAGLWLAIEHGFSGEDVRAVHRRMGHPSPLWPAFEPPQPLRTWTTVVDVAEEGLRAGSTAGHARATTRWAEEVWEAWQEDSPGVDDVVEALLRDIFRAGGQADTLHGTIGPASAVHRLRGLLHA